MKVDVSHHVDASEPDAEGLHDYHYEYDIFTFSDGTTWLAARAYADEPQRAAFMTSNSHALTVQDLHHPLFVEAVAYLRAAGKRELSWFCASESRYIPIVASRYDDEKSRGATFGNTS